MNEEKYAWPGGYERFAVMTDGEVMCIDCVNDPTNPVYMASRFPLNKDGWGIVDFDNMSNYDESENCCNCGKVIE